MRTKRTPALHIVILIPRTTETALVLCHLLCHLLLHSLHNIQSIGLQTVQVALRQVAMTIDCTLHLSRPPPIPVVFDRVQDLAVVAIKELR